jgi:hypothetical protein
VVQDIALSSNPSTKKKRVREEKNAAFNPSYIGGRGRRITVQVQPGQKHKTLPEKQTKHRRTRRWFKKTSTTRKKKKIIIEKCTGFNEKSKINKWTLFSGFVFILIFFFPVV